MYMKKVLYLDLDGTLVDFQSGIDRLPIGKREAYRDNYDDTPGIFSLMDPMPGGVEAFRQLAEVFDTYILSTAPWDNPSAWSEHDWVGDLHHRRFEVQREKHATLLCFLNRFLVEAAEPLAIHVSGIQHLSRLEW